MKIKLLLLLFFIISCKSDNISYSYPSAYPEKRETMAGKLFSSNMEVRKNIKNKKNNTSDLKTNLWAKTFITLSKKFPILSTDKENGFISTDWSSFNDKNTRFKANAFVSENDVEITVFKEVLKNNVWISEGKDDKFGKSIENEIKKNDY